MSSPVETLYDEYQDIKEFLCKHNEISLVLKLNENFIKIIVLSSASYFEDEIKQIIKGFVKKSSNNNEKLISFVDKKAIGMQYHTFFTWGEKNDPQKPHKNANTFFSLFGTEFKKNLESQIKQDTELAAAMRAFLEIGHLRNILVHSNFAAYQLGNKTIDEVLGLYKQGLVFIEFIKQKLD